MVAVLKAGGRPKKSRGGWEGETSRMVGVAHQLSYHLPQCPWDGQTAHSEPEEKPAPPPAGEQKPEDTQISGEPDTEVTGPPEAVGGAGAGEILLLPGGRSEPLSTAPILLLSGVGGPQFSGGEPASCRFSHQGTLSAKAIFFRFFRAAAGPGAGSQRHFPVYPPDRNRARQRPCRVRPCERGGAGGCFSAVNIQIWARTQPWGVCVGVA